MAEAARRRGHAYQVLTDHSQSLAIARGLDAGAGRASSARSSPSSTRASRPRRRAGTAPPETPPEGFRLLHGCELEIRADGQLDYRRRAARDVRPRRGLAPRLAPPAPRRADPADAQRDPEPARRRHRPPVGPDDRQTRDDLDLDWDAVYAEAAADRHGPRDERLAAPAGPVGRAGPPGASRTGCLLSIDSDAHHTARARLPPLGHLARRAGPGSSPRTC